MYENEQQINDLSIKYAGQPRVHLVVGQFEFQGIIHCPGILVSLSANPPRLCVERALSQFHAEARRIRGDNGEKSVSNKVVSDILNRPTTVHLPKRPAAE